MSLSKHAVDTSVSFSEINYQDLPEELEVENPDMEPDAEGNPEMTTVAREPYLADPKLAEAVDLAIALGRPLLLQGDPGSGKTRLAYAVAYALQLPLEVISVKSTSRAQDLLYTYDAVTRLYHAQLGVQAPKDEQGRPLAESARNYMRLGPLGRAIARAQHHKRRSVVLIDEIDKADLDFPNDLLWELEELSFKVNEVPGLRYTAENDTKLRPIVVITHNEEKALPTAFLRRCIFYHVKFPESEEDLLKIIELHKKADPNTSQMKEHPELRARAVRVVKELRDLNLSKPPGLSELLDWIGYLRDKETDPSTLVNLPHLGALVKEKSDQQRAITEYKKKSTARQETSTK